MIKNITSNKILSIITVTYNAEDSIRKTIDSVLNQTYNNYEYIIIDGASTDKTYEIECSYDESFARRAIRYFHISEQDDGIFDAMNKGLDYCQSEWIYYLGAGDVLYQSCTLKEIFEKSKKENINIIYGGVMRKKGDKQFYRPPQKLVDLEYTMPFGHQASFVRTSIMKKYKFDTSYKLAGDYDLMVRLYSDGQKFEEIDKVIAVFDLSGASQTGLKQIAMEFKKIQIKYGFYQKNRFCHLIRTDIGIPLKGNKFVYGLYMKLMQMRY